MDLENEEKTTQPAASSKPQLERKAYAKLVGKSGSFYLHSLSVVIGREAQGKRRPDIALGSNLTISRRQGWEFETLSKNGAYVDGLFVPFRYSPMPLLSRSLIQIADRLFYFLLPTTSPDMTPQHVTVLPRGIQTAGSVGSPWIKTERDQFKDAFLSYGWGRWDQILRLLDTKTRTHAELENYAVHFLSLLMNATTENNDALVEVFNRIRRHPVSASQLDPSMHKWPAIVKNGNSMSKKVILMLDFRQACEGADVAALLRDLGPTRGPSPIPWWQSADDLDLIKGVWKHGLGRWDDIRDDPSLKFARQFKGKSAAPARSAMNNTSSSNSNSSQAASSVKLNLSDAALAASDPLTIMGSLPMTMTDMISESKQQSVTATATGTDATDGPHWVLGTKLHARFKRLVNAFKRLAKKTGQKRRKGEADVTTDDHEEPSPSPKRAKTTMSVRERDKLETKRKKQSERMLKRELDLFVRQLIIHGKPASWDVIRDAEDHLKYKSDALLDRTFGKIVAELRKTRLRLPPSLDQVGRDSSSLEELGYDLASRPRLASNLSDALCLLDVLRSQIATMPEEKIAARVTALPQRTDLPGWWTSACDVALLQGVNKHGWDLDAVADDSELLFGPGYAVELLESAPLQRALNKRLRELISLWTPAEYEQSDSRMTVDSSDNASVASNVSQAINGATNE